MEPTGDYCHFPMDERAINSSYICRALPERRPRRLRGGWLDVGTGGALSLPIGWMAFPLIRPGTTSTRR